LGESDQWKAFIYTFHAEFVPVESSMLIEILKEYMA
jgi:hypothetical protein